MSNSEYFSRKIVLLRRLRNAAFENRIASPFELEILFFDLPCLFSIRSAGMAVFVLNLFRDYGDEMIWSGQRRRRSFPLRRSLGDRCSSCGFSYKRLTTTAAPRKRSRALQMSARITSPPAHYRTMTEFHNSFFTFIRFGGDAQPARSRRLHSGLTSTR